MAKHASDAGLAGVAEAAGHLIGELTPASKWRQEILQIRLVAGLTLAMLLGKYDVLVLQKRFSHLILLYGLQD